MRVVSFCGYLPDGLLPGKPFSGGIMRYTACSLWRCLSTTTNYAFQTRVGGRLCFPQSPFLLLYPSKPHIQIEPNPDEHGDQKG